MTKTTRVRLAPRTAEDCSKIETHTAGPSGYLAWHAWAERMAKTHEQTKCPGCGFWSIWVPKSRSSKTEERG